MKPETLFRYIKQLYKKINRQPVKNRDKKHHHTIDSNEPFDEQMVDELNQRTARYTYLLTYIGSSVDSGHLRDEMRKNRQRLWELVKLTKLTIVPALRSKAVKAEIVNELEVTYRTFCAVLAYLEDQFLKALLLQREFPLFTGSCVLIQTGLSDPPLTHKCGNSQDMMEVNAFDNSIQEKEDLRNLERDIEEIHEMRQDVTQAIPIQPWEIEPEIETDKNTSHIQATDTLSKSSENFATIGDERHRRRRCVSFLLVCLVIIISASVIGVVTGILRS
ncbi:hypothetical protein CHS0354_017838 [Potamilus streckersoni]|uniref:Uncharacterized protein n=1 Tax=Potamilus streckersoni TaxID=2493646 RepID=A0AAE0T7Q8_9BIVA|nr:hypothetical protein CHS0354_017838 [Potamilus streckersoni]